MNVKSILMLDISGKGFLYQVMLFSVYISNTKEQNVNYVNNAALLNISFS